MRSTRHLVLGSLLVSSLAACPEFKDTESYCQTWADCPVASAGSYAYCYQNKCGVEICGTSCSWKLFGFGKERWLCDISQANCGFDCSCPGSCADTFAGVFPAKECTEPSTKVGLGSDGGVCSDLGQTCSGSGSGNCCASDSTCAGICCWPSGHACTLGSRANCCNTSVCAAGTGCL